LTEKLSEGICLLSNGIDEKDTHIVALKQRLIKLVTYQEKDIKGKQDITGPVMGKR
jgi:hypothetical protein